MCGGDAEVRKGGAREAGKEKGIVEKGVAERKRTQGDRRATHSP